MTPLNSHDMYKASDPDARYAYEYLMEVKVRTEDWHIISIRCSKM